jgi:hypothetical protein
VKNKFKLKSKVWQYPGMAGWHFLSVSKKESDEIRKGFGARAKGWGSLPVTVTLGDTSWNTSIFPESKSGTYLLPLKAAVRKKEAVFHGDTVSFTIEVRA